MKKKISTKSDLLFYLADSINKNFILHDDLIYIFKNFDHEYDIFVKRGAGIKFATKGRHKEIWSIYPETQVYQCWISTIYVIYHKVSKNSLYSFEDLKKSRNIK